MPRYAWSLLQMFAPSHLIHDPIPARVPIWESTLLRLSLRPSLTMSDSAVKIDCSVKPALAVFG